MVSRSGKDCYASTQLMDGMDIRAHPSASGAASQDPDVIPNIVYIAFGSRGILNYELTAYIPTRPPHFNILHPMILLCRSETPTLIGTRV
uniref:Uncharacterized protein n=1 Tax=Candidatus Methanogaster sp. ANME-2c ERB4 TaxID=2759911 RepID=A0A7G9Y5S4_9EURY|nr:hypothetical protein LDCPFDIN_00006 [Methanosarcinales archaeon ANME-2c ERB4]QNO46519.1 hypothetical protein AGAEODOH_00003 [Methanosarcinales archaeon ANME-2c ERB4]